mgnify:CR=1 FL=1
MGIKVNNRKIAVLSGKGGTGKTLLSVNLAEVAANSEYIDCDVEEPNGHLFFKPDICHQETVTVKIPRVDQDLCDGCRKCVDFCNFNALAYIKNQLHIYEEICHSCGGCVLLCPQKALTEKDKPIGILQIGFSNGVRVKTGILNTGEPSGIPIIDKLLADTQTNPYQTTFIDCPPGSACIVMETIKDADYCVLVAEPTLFGVHNLNMVYELVTLFNKPFGVVLNKCQEGENLAEEFCITNNIEILGDIPFDEELGTLNSDGKIVSRESEKFRQLFEKVLTKITEKVQNETAPHS